jgi:uncharacterized protein YqjF (DUF2071 family)
MNRATPSSHLRDVDKSKVFLSAQWRHLAMLNYEVDPRLLARFVPSGTELDTSNGKTFISLVGFRFLNTKLFGACSISLHTNFEEVNLRFYVRRREGSDLRRGVTFIREIVPRRAIAFVARTFYKENYIARPMAHNIRTLPNQSLAVEYKWRGGNRWNTISLETQGNPEIPLADSAEQFITEHYWGYAAQPGGGCVEYRVAHPAWRVWQARHAAFDGATEDLYGKDLAAALRAQPHSAFLAEGSDISVMRGRRL